MKRKTRVLNQGRRKIRKKGVKREEKEKMKSNREKNVGLLNESIRENYKEDVERKRKG